MSQRRLLLRSFGLTLAALGALAALSASCGDDSCEVTLTCPPPGSGSGGAGQGGGSGATGGGGDAGLSNGEPCSTADACSSDICVDDVCCDAACDGACVACNLSGSEGTCTPIAAGESDDTCDDVCDGSGNCVSGGHLWSQRFDASEGFGVATDGSNNVVITGRYTSSADLGTGPLPTGDNHTFVAKYDPMGNAMWSIGTNGVAENCRGQATAIDTNDNVIVAGEFGLGDVSFGFPALDWTTEQDAFLAKFTSSGQHLWSKDFGGTSEHPAFGVATDSNDNIAMCGTSLNNIDLGGGMRMGSGAFLAVFSPTGNYVWDQYLAPTNGGASGNAVIFDSADNLIVVGSFSGDLMTGGPMLSAAGVSAFIAKYDSDGNHLWSANFGDASRAHAVAVASDDSIVFGGEYSASIDFGGGTLPTGGADDMFVVKLDADGNHVWSHGYGDAQDQRALGLAIDAQDNVVITGGFSGSINLGGGGMSASGEDVFIAKLSTGGEHVWSNRFGDTNQQAGHAVAVDTNSNILFTGEMNGGTDFGGGVLSTSGPASPDPFLVKLAP